jgi:uncharacterized membrane protein (DUF4010 family)
VETWEPYISYAMALFSGLLIGLEREHSRSEQTDAAGHFTSGVRTTPLFSLAAAISASLSSSMGVWPFLIMLAGAMSFAVVSYAKSLAAGYSGLTSIGAFIVAVMLGGLSGTSSVFSSASQKIFVVAALSVVTTLLLSGKPFLHNFSSKISRDDVIATLKFLMVAVVVLPLLPDAPLGPWGVLNPHKLGLMVALLAGVSFVGYAASRILGRGRGLLWTGAIGGLVSSTAVTLSASRQTKAEPELANLSALSIVVASTVMPIRVVIVAGATSAPMTQHLLWPMAAMTLMGVTYAGFLYWRTRSKQPKPEEPALKNPFELGSTLQLALLLVGVMLFSKWATHEFGQAAAYATAFFAGLADVDAITLSMARLVQTRELALRTAAASVFIAVASNTLVKGGMAAVLGNRALALRVGAGFALMLAAGAVGLLLGALLGQ